MTRFGMEHGIPIIDGYGALRSVWHTTNTPKLGGSLSLGHLIPALGVRRAEEHDAFEDSVDVVLVYRALLLAVSDELKL